MKQRIQDRNKYWEERRKLKQKHEKEWQEKRRKEREEDRKHESSEFHRDEQCPESKTRTLPCDEEGFKVKKITSYHFDFSAKKCVPYVSRHKLRCAPAPSTDDEGERRHSRRALDADHPSINRDKDDEMDAEEYDMDGDGGERSRAGRRRRGRGATQRSRRLRKRVDDDLRDAKSADKFGG